MAIVICNPFGVKSFFYYLYLICQTPYIPYSISLMNSSATYKSP